MCHEGHQVWALPLEVLEGGTLFFSLQEQVSKEEEPQEWWWRGSPVLWIEYRSRV